MEQRQRYGASRCDGPKLESRNVAEPGKKEIKRILSFASVKFFLLWNNPFESKNFEMEKVKKLKFSQYNAIF